MQTFKPAIRWWSLVRPRIIAHFSETLEVHPDRLMYRKGILSENEVVIPFSRITNYSVDQNLFDRMFGIGNFRIETAGSIAPELTLVGYSYQLRDILAQSLNISN
jgi:membrane protein YdbS with pleckstrin-like domain